MGRLYLYTFPNNKKYIGQTKNSLAQRTAQHVYEALHTPDKGCILLNKAINKYGVTNFEREEITECEDDEMDFLEIEFIELYNTLQPNGYNLKVGGNNVPHAPEIIAKRARSLRKKEDEKDLPQFTKSEIKRGRIRWRINNHPLCSNAAFDSREEMLEFLNKLENGEIEPIVAKPRMRKNNPQYICERKYGYVIEIKGKYIKSFLDKNRNKEDLLNEAILYVQNLVDN